MNKSLVILEPYELEPIDSGGKVRAANTIKELSKYFHTTVIASPPKQKRLFSFIKTGVPYWFSDWATASQNVTIPAADTTLVEYTQLLHVIKVLPKTTKKIFTAYDISTVSFWRRLVSEPNLVKKIIGLIRWLEVYRYEKKYIPQYDLVIAVSQHDAHILKHWFGAQTVAVIPNGVEQINQLPPRLSDGYLNLGFIGLASHPPNRQAIDFLITQLSPALTKQHQKHRIILAGHTSYPNSDIVQNRGYITNVQDFYQDIDILVAPIFSGSGSRIKILESLSFGRPVITTAVGAEGIDLRTSFIKTIPSSESKNPDQWVHKILSSVNYSDFPTADLANLTWEYLFKNNWPLFVG